MFLFSSIDLLYGAIVSQVFTIFKNGACSCVRDATIMVQVRECMFEKVSGKATKLRVDRPIN